MRAESWAALGFVPARIRPKRIRPTRIRPLEQKARIRPNVQKVRIRPTRIRPPEQKTRIRPTKLIINLLCFFPLCIIFFFIYLGTK